MLNNPITQRLLSIAFFLLTAGLLMVLMILVQGPYIFVFVAIAILILGIIFIKAISDQDRCGDYYRNEYTVPYAMSKSIEFSFLTRIIIKNQEEEGQKEGHHQ